MKCRKDVYCKHIQKTFKCLRQKHHSGWHVPDLVGLKIGSYIVIEKAKSRRTSPLHTNQTMWKVLYEDGTQKELWAANIVSGSAHGKYSGNGYCRKNGKHIAEYRTVHGHHDMIFDGKERYITYRGMPFYDEWNPDKGGAFWKGVKWIIDNLGPKPGPEWSMDIIEHKKGFWPGNLRWALKNDQARNKQHRKLGQYTDEEFLVEARKRGFTLVAPSENQLSSINQ